jgi:two-component sensor histidine kinase
MGERIRSHDWAATSLGPIQTWPQSLRTMVDLMLASQQPVYIAWGPELTSLYNDSYVPILGSKHPEALGKPYLEVWPEIWDEYRPIVAATMAGEAQYFIDRLVALAGRSGRPMSWFSFSWTPVRDEAGSIAGFYCAATESTDKILAQDALRESRDAALHETGTRYRALFEALDQGFCIIEMVFDEQNRPVDYVFVEVILSSYSVAGVESVEQDASGNRKHFDNSMAGIVEDGQLKRLWGIQRDITDRKQAEEQRTLLIHELNHRVKNTLATVQSIASQTLRNAPTMRDAKEALEGRLIALARAHDVLTRESWEGAELKDIVGQAIAPYTSRDENRFHVSGPEIRLSPRMALALAMALQELATNAVKYGALANATGEIRITWDVEPALPKPRIHLRWEESGGPPVRAPNRRGFGSRLIERSLSQDLNGIARIEFRPTGIVCTVDAPLA